MRRFCVSFDRTVDRPTFDWLQSIELPAFPASPMNRTDKRSSRLLPAWFADSPAAATFQDRVARRLAELSGNLKMTGGDAPSQARPLRSLLPLVMEDASASTEILVEKVEIRERLMPYRTAKRYIHQIHYTYLPEVEQAVCVCV
jgi:hypothetical protein